MAKFKRGDVCIIVNAESEPVNGMEVTILGDPYVYIDFFSKEKTLGYPTDLIWCGFKVTPQEKNLRLKSFPGEESVMRMFSQPIKEEELV